MARSKSASRQTHRQVNTLKNQLYGRMEPTVTRTQTQNVESHSGSYNQYLFNQKTEENLSTSSRVDHSNYLKKDLFKVLYLSTLAIGFQLGLYWAVTSGIVRF